MIKFLASDFDGTLFRDNQIKVEDLNAIKELRNENNKMILATGRSLNEIKKELSAYPFQYDYLVLCNGAMILDGNDKEIYRNLISNDTRKAIINKFFNIGDALLYYDDGNGVKIIENRNVNTSNMDGDFLRNNSNVITLEHALNDECDCEIMSIFVTNNSIEHCEKIRSLVYESFSDNVEAFRNSYFVDIVSKGCSKGNALLDILNHENAKKEQLYCIGDSMNDITMFNVTPNSYTFNYTEEIVKTHACHLVDNVYEVIEHM